MYPAPFCIILPSAGGQSRARPHVQNPLGWSAILLVPKTLSSAASQPHNVSLYPGLPCALSRPFSRPPFPLFFFPFLFFFPSPFRFRVLFLNPSTLCCIFVSSVSSCSPRPFLAFFGQNPSFLSSKFPFSSHWLHPLPLLKHNPCRLSL